MGLPLRHVRPHVGFTWLIAPVSSDSTRDVMSAEIAATLMDLIEDHATGQTFTYGNLWSTEKQAFYCVPDTLQENPPRVFTLAKEVSSSILQFAPVLGVQFGTGCKATEALVNIPYGKLVVWNRHNRPSYKITPVVPSRRYTLTSRGSYSDFSFFLVYNLGGDEVTDKALDVPVDDLDTSSIWSPSTIPWHPIDFDDEDSPWLPAPMPPVAPPPMPPAPPVVAPPSEISADPEPVSIDDISISSPPAHDPEPSNPVPLVPAALPPQSFSPTFPPCCENEKFLYMTGRAPVMMLRRLQRLWMAIVLLLLLELWISLLHEVKCDLL